MDGQETWLEKNDSGWAWEPVAKVSLEVDGPNLMLAVPRKHLGIPDGDAARFDFKWWDNSQNPGDIMDTYLSGDVAPDARFRFRYAIPPSANR